MALRKYVISEPAIGTDTGKMTYIETKADIETKTERKRERDRERRSCRYDGTERLPDTRQRKKEEESDTHTHRESGT